LPYIDTCPGLDYQAIRSARGITLITADHGNAEQMIDPKTGHRNPRTQPIRCRFIDDSPRGVKLREGGAWKMSRRRCLDCWN